MRLIRPSRRSLIVGTPTIIAASALGLRPALAAVAFNWVNGTDNSFLSNVTTINVGSSNAFTTNGAFTAGDILLVFLYVKGITSGTVTNTGGFTQLATGQTDGVGWLTCWYKVAGASESGSYAFSFPSGGGCWLLADYTGASSTIDGSAVVASNTGTTSITLGPITTTNASDLLVAYIASSNDPAAAGPAGWTSRWNQTQFSSGVIVSLTDHTASSAGSQSPTGTGSVSRVCYSACRATAYGSWRRWHQLEPLRYKTY
jgi:hypothetical protein